MNNRFEIKEDKVSIFLDRRDGSVIETIISIEHLRKVQEFPCKWVAQWNRYTKSFYVQGNNPMDGRGHTTVRLHRFLMDCPDDLTVDHINRDTLDNTITNLRNVTRAMNSQNITKRVDNKSGFLGVCWNKSSKKWYVQVTVNKKRKYIGRFDDIDQAAEVARQSRIEFCPGYVNQG